MRMDIDRIDRVEVDPILVFAHWPTISVGNSTPPRQRVKTVGPAPPTPSDKR
jgi:hypothetical protein